MKHRKYVGVAALLLVVVTALAWVGVASAQSFRSGDTATVPAQEKLDSSLYATGRMIDIAGEVDGDVFCAGQNVSISGKVSGDVICAGQTITISGTVEGDVRLAGQTVTIGGKVEGNASVAGQSFTLESGGAIEGDGGMAVQDVVLYGPVGRDLAATGNTLRVNDDVGRNIKATVSQLELGQQANVKGDMTYTSHNTVQVADGAKVSGSTVQYEPPQQNKHNWDKGRVIGFGIAVAVMVIISLLLTSIVLALLFPADLHVLSKWALNEPLKTFFIGLAAWLGVPMVVLVLMVTVVGIPLALILLGIWLLIMILNGPVFSYYLGRLIWRSQRNPVLIMLVGASIVLVSYLIPILGGIMCFAVMSLGTGMFVRQLLRRTPKPKYDVSKT